MRKFVWLIVAIVVVVGAWSAGWLWAASELRKQVDLLAANDGETAPKVTCGTLNVSGFPFRFDVECIDSTVTDLDVTVNTAGVRLSAMVYNPTHVLVSALSPVTIDNAFTGARSRVDFTSLAGSGRLASRDIFEGLSGVGWRIANISLVVDGVTWNDTVVDDMLRMSADHIEAHLVDMPEGRDKAAHTAMLGAYATISNLALPQLEITGAQSTLDARIDKLPDDLNELLAPDAIRAWQARGGKVTLIKFAGTQPNPEESFDIAGEVSLNAAGLANGSVTYTTKGVLDRLLGTFVPPVQLAALKGMPKPDGSATNIIAIGDGRVTLAGILLAELLPAF